MTIRNESKWTIFASGGFGLLQMVSESDTGRCASEDAGPLRRADCEILHRWRGDEAFLILVWKPLPSTHVLKP